MFRRFYSLIQKPRSYKYKFVDFPEIKLEDIILCMNNGVHYRIIKKTEKLYLGKDPQGRLGEFRMNFIEDHPISDFSNLDFQLGCLTLIKRTDTKRFIEGAFNLGREHLVIDPEKPDHFYWSDEILKDGTVVTDGKRSLKIISWNEKYHNYTDYGSTGKEEPWNHSYYEYVDINDPRKIEKLHAGHFASRLIEHYPVLVL